MGERVAWLSGFCLGCKVMWILVVELIGGGWFRFFWGGVIFDAYFCGGVSFWVLWGWVGRHFDRVGLVWGGLWGCLRVGFFWACGGHLWVDLRRCLCVDYGFVCDFWRFLYTVFALGLVGGILRLRDVLVS